MPGSEGLRRGRKTFEVRHDDRGYSKGNFLRLRGWQPITCDTGQYTGRMLTVRIA